MRTDSSNTHNYLHYHDGCTCHGSPTLEACVQEAINARWFGKVLEKIDKNEVGKTVKCYSLISGGAESYAHWAKYGKFVADVEQHIKVQYTRS